MVVRCVWLLQRDAIEAQGRSPSDRKLYMRLRILKHSYVDHKLIHASEKSNFFQVDPSVLRGDRTLARLYLSDMLSARGSPTTDALIRDIISFADRMRTLPCSDCGSATAAGMPPICGRCGGVGIIRVCILLATTSVDREGAATRVEVDGDGDGDGDCDCESKYSAAAYLDEFGSKQMVTLEKVKVKVKMEGGGSGEQCSVCLEQFGEEDVEVSRMPCSHLFHSHCIHQWLHRRRACPFCRFQLPCTVFGSVRLSKFPFSHSSIEQS